MANRTAAHVRAKHGLDPQHLVESIIRSHIYDSAYWREHCFGLNSKTILDEAVNRMDAVGGTIGAHQAPTIFLCLLLKLLQIQPANEIIIDCIQQNEFKYLRCLAAFYWRLTASAVDIYVHLEPLLSDYRRIRMQRNDGGMELRHIDEFIEELLVEDRVCDMSLPYLPKRSRLEKMTKLTPYDSALPEEEQQIALSSQNSEIKIEE